VTFIICPTKRHIQNLTSFHGWLDPTIIYRDPVLFQEVIKNWSLDGKVVCLVTISDNAANIKAATKLLKMHHLPYSAHTLNLTVNDAINGTPQLHYLLKKCRDIVGRFKRSTVAMNILRAEQMVRNKPQLKLLQDVSTRWNSVNLMVNRILVIEYSLTVALLKLDDAPQLLTAEEFKILKEAIEVLEPFDNATKQLSGVKYVTAYNFYYYR
jgi:hypothetical protein